MKQSRTQLPPIDYTASHLTYCKRLFGNVTVEVLGLR